MKKYTTILFDLDGTLLSTELDLAESVNAILNQFGFPTRSLEEIKAFTGNGLKMLLKKSLPHEVEEDFFEEIFTAFKSYYLAHSQHHTKPYDKIMELIQVLYERGYKIGIVSNKNHQAVTQLNQLFFKPYIEVALGENEACQKKPAPDLVYRALELLGSSKNEALYIGDSEVDIATAQNAEVESVLVGWGFRSKKALYDAGAKQLINAPLELLDLLEE